MKQTPFGKEESKNAQAGYQLGQDGRQAGALDAHAEGEDKQRVQCNIKQGADQDRTHGNQGIALCENKRIQTLGQHHKDRAAGINFQIGYGKGQCTGRAAEQPHDRLGQEKGQRAQKKTEYKEQGEGRIKNSVGLSRIALAQLDAGPGRAAKADQIGKSLQNQRNRQHNSEGGQRIHADAFDPGDIHPIYNIIKKGNQLGQHGRRRKPEYQRQNPALLQLFCHIRRRSVHNRDTFKLKIRIKNHAPWGAFTERV